MSIYEFIEQVGYQVDYIKLKTILAAFDTVCTIKFSGC